jgi:ketosteroid isomerase-like protein
MFQKSTLLSSLASIFMMIASAQSQASELPQSISLPPELQNVLSKYQAAWQNSESKTLARLFSEDGFVLANGNEPIRGRKQIEEYYSNSGSSIVLRPFAYQIDENLAYILGGITKKDMKNDLAKFTIILRKVEGEWKIISDMDNRNKKSR